MYNKEKYMLDQRVAESKRGVEEEERRLESLASPEELDRLTAEHNASIDQLRIQIEVGCSLTAVRHRVDCVTPSTCTVSLTRHDAQ